VSIEFTNSAPYSLALLRWNLPFDDRFGSDSFHIIHNGKPVKYLGPKVKYAGPDAMDYVMIAANESVAVEVVLSNNYDFSKPGHYDMVFVADVLDYVTEYDFADIPHRREQFSPLKGIMTNSLRIITTTPLEPENLLAPVPCSSTQNDQINSAASAQKTMIGYSVQRINEGDSSTYLEWFGTYTSSRWSTVRNGMTDIADNSVVGYQCDNRQGIYAYVFPGDRTHQIYLCGNFWSSKEVGGFDTKAGTLIHELSHFSDIVGTDDWVYGTEGARNLASTDPARAVDNADNFEYFSEDLWH
jgi:peptidyl-Lys metalloendopeptidase